MCGMEERKFDTDTVIKNTHDKSFNDDRREVIYPSESELKITGWYSTNGKIVYQLVYVDEQKTLDQKTILNDPQLEPVDIEESVFE